MERVNNNRGAVVSWTPLTLHQAKGFPVYFVTYQPSSQVGRVVRAVNVVNTTDARVMIDDLDPLTEYAFSVDVGTAEGQHRSTVGAGMLKFLVHHLATCTHSCELPAWCLDMDLHTRLWMTLCCYFSIFTVSVTLAAVPTTEMKLSVGVVVGAVVGIVGGLLLIAIAVVIVTAIVIR